MRLGKWLLVGAVICLLAGFPSVTPAQQSQQEKDIVEAARKAREMKKSAPKAKRVFTNDDIQGAQAAGTEQAPPQEGAQTPTESAAAATTAAPADASKPKGPDEAEWRKRFAELRARIATAEKELDILQRELNLNQQQYYSDPNKALREQYTRNEINEGRAKIEQKRQELAQLKQQLSDLEDELRKAGGPPAWAREP